MKYRLIRFDREGNVVLDKPCITPNQYGDNYEWRNTGCKAVLIEYTVKMTKSPDGHEVKDRVPKFYNMYAESREFPEALWQLQSLDELAKTHKYIEMLQLTGAL